jgi:hypothetical protein
MKFRLRIIGLLDAITFLIFISAKANYLSTAFSLSYALNNQIGAIWEFLVLFLFLISAILLWFKPIQGLYLSFLLIPFRIVFLYFSLDFLSYAAYYLGYVTYISTAIFQKQWFYFLLLSEGIRYVFSFYWYYQIKSK